MRGVQQRNDGSEERGGAGDVTRRGSNYFLSFPRLVGLAVSSSVMIVARYFYPEESEEEEAESGL